jgi:hypothetical protein
MYIVRIIVYSYIYYTNIFIINNLLFLYYTLFLFVIFIVNISWEQT